MDPGSILQVFGSLLFLAAQGLVWAAVIVVAAVRWERVRPAFKLGVMVGAAILALKLPSMIASAIFIDPTAVMPTEDESMRPFLELGLRAGIAGAFVFSFIGIFHIALQIGLAEDALAGRSAYPTLFNRPVRFGGWKIGAVVGTVAGIVSVLLFVAIGAEPGSALDWLEEIMPGYYSVSPIVRYALAIPAVAGIALAEEILFRGVIQRWITRLLGGGTAAVWVAIVIASAWWTLGHVGNVDPAWAKLLQIFILGLIFGRLADRHGVESACLAHACLNVSAAFIGMIFEWG